MLDHEFEAQRLQAKLKKAGITLEQFRKMSPSEAIKAGMGDGDWREGLQPDATPQKPGFPDVTVGFHKQVPQTPPSSSEEDEEVTIARQEREKAANDPVIQDLAKRLGVPVNFLLDYRERAIGQFGQRLDHLEDETQQQSPS